MIIIMIIIIRDGYHLNSLPWAQLYLSVPNRFFSIPMVSNHVMFVVRVYMGVGLFWGCSVDGRWVVVRLAIQNTYVQHFNCNYGCVCLFQCMRECACVISVMHDQLEFSMLQRIIQEYAHWYVGPGHWACGPANFITGILFVGFLFYFWFFIQTQAHTRTHTENILRQQVHFHVDA